MTSLNLAYNDLHTLPHSVFSDLNLLQTLKMYEYQFCLVKSACIVIESYDGNPNF